ncbi:MAG: M6 family metalloprotease domain-containing protein [Candidatus Cloacimonetes bacterium]|nr:M6 family metalloprotease domain-containing protein [Candidatus Cloacimonadota bacterium]
MKRILNLLLFIAILLPLTAIPAPPYAITYMQPDGSTLEMFNRGDEFVHWGESLDGYTLLSNNDGYKVYAVQDENGGIMPGSVIANNLSSRTSEETAFLASNPKYLHYSASQIERFRSTSHYNNMGRMGGFPTTGVNNMLVILANFSDTNTTYSQTSFNNLMNQDNYGGHGSFKQYYLENSWGQLEINSTVVGWVTLPHNHDYYGPESRWGEFARDAVAAAEAQGIDFSIFDNDNDGTVDGVALVHQGMGQEISGDSSDIWSHSSSISYNYNVHYDGVEIGPYTAQPEKNNWSSMTTMGVFAHEVGHNLGTPDFYDVDYQQNGSYVGTGDWDVMGGGSYHGSPSGSLPCHHNPWTKIFYNWVEPVILTEVGDYPLPRIVDNPVIYRLDTRTDNEYFLFENRQQVGFDDGIPYHGMMIYQVDGTYISQHYSSNTINNDAHQGMRPRPAFGGVNGSGAPFPGTHNEHEFDDTTNPSSINWAGMETNRPISAITESSGNITFHMGFEFPAQTPQWLEYSVTQNHVALAWLPPQDVSQVLGYSVYRDGQFRDILPDISMISFTDSNLPDGTYVYHITSLTYEGESEPSNQVTVLVNYTANDENEIPGMQTELLTNYPNPFNPETSIAYNLNTSSNVELSIYNILGKKVKTLVNSTQPAGNHNIIWNGSDDNGNALSSGVYFYKLQAGTYTKTRKMILIK